MKIALITGSSRGLGRNMAQHLAQKNIGIILTYLKNKKEADQTVSEIEKSGGQAIALQFDAGQISSLSQFIKNLETEIQNKWKTNKIDFLINNAGHGTHASFDQTSEHQFDHLMNVHLKGPFFLTQKILPFMNDGGKILNISTGLTRFALPGYAAYATMKGAMETLTKYMAKELGGRKISVNILAPGAIETDFGGGAVRDNKDLNNFIASQTALGRVGQPDDIGLAVVNLLSDGSSWINAQRIEASGGMFL